MPRIIGAALCAALMTVGAAQAQAVREWSHKDWRAYQRDDGRCGIWTGSDGAGTLVIEMEPGGYDASADYTPVWYSSEAPPLLTDDYVVLFIDGRESWLGEEMFVYDGKDQWGESYRSAGMTSGLVAELIAQLRPGDVLDVARQRGPEDPLTLDSFSLSGFTAVLLKTAEWCRFNPKLMPGS